MFVFVQKKFGSLENAKPMYDNMVLEAQKENLQFKLSSITKTPNTVASHILIDLARKEKVQKEVVYNIFSDYFEKGIELAIDNGLKVKPIDISNFMCIEIDFIDDLILAKEQDILI